MTGRWRLIAAGAFVTVAAAAAAAPTRVGRATAPLPAAIDDTAALGALLRSVRGAAPLLCEMAARHVDAQGWWSSGGSESGGALETDSASAAVIRWLRERPHDARLVPALSTALRDSDRCVRRLAGSLLGRVDHVSARAALRSALGDAAPETREVAAIGLGLAEDSAGAAGLTQRLRDPSASVRRASAWALGNMEYHAALPQLIELLERDPDARVRQAAAWAVGRVAG